MILVLSDSCKKMKMAYIDLLCPFMGQEVSITLGCLRAYVSVSCMLSYFRGFPPSFDSLQFAIDWGSGERSYTDYSNLLVTAILTEFSIQGHIRTWWPHWKSVRAPRPATFYRILVSHISDSPHILQDDACFRFV